MDFKENFPKTISDFLNYCLAVKGLSPNTVKGYASDLKLFSLYLLSINENSENENKDKNEEKNQSKLDQFKDEYLTNATIEILVDFLSYTQIELDNSAYARARKISCLKAFFTYLCDIKKIITVNPTHHLPIPKVPKRNPVYLTLEESKRLLDTVEKMGGKNKERDYCIVSIFLNCGLRLSELCSIDRNKIVDDTLRVIGKGNKERVVYLNKAVMQALNKYLPLREAQDSTLPQELKNVLFISSKKMRISERTVERMVKKYAKLAGLDYDKLTPHKLRHTAATLMYKYGNVDVRSIQDILGHESISTTEIYTHIDEENLREAVYANPLNEDIE
ncbi:Site-specific recombinase XerD [Hathewaya proteolytica DSM 3090]|uniref:Site-specific recombinase XerD n=1 Tax=Hathewaya proteolytica DSM 3090 TaxID=1121331 RepID=A0A1M6J2R6_9CLOT|nr:tyrosine recombinase XerC [Hathewaya proteolytica]SHJ40988.1 Site-specific recombinase XerD [Hathewaya proteolytica DSM 3090]